MKQICNAITQKLFGRARAAAPAPQVKPIDEKQLRAISGGGPYGTWGPYGNW